MKGLYVDCIRTLVLVAVFLFVERIPPHVREQSLDDPVVGKPHLDDIISGPLLLLLSFSIPIALFLVIEMSNGYIPVKNMLIVYSLGLFECIGM